MRGPVAQVRSLGARAPRPRVECEPAIGSRATGGASTTGLAVSSAVGPNREMLGSGAKSPAASEEEGSNEPSRGPAGATAALLGNTGRDDREPNEVSDAGIRVGVDPPVGEMRGRPEAEGCIEPQRYLQFVSAFFSFTQVPGRDDAEDLPQGRRRAEVAALGINAGCSVPSSPARGL